MPIFAILLEDDPERAADVRRRVLPAHLAFLDANASRIRFAGPLHDPVANTPAGGLWMAEARDRGEVEVLIDADPFWGEGLRRAVRVLEWRQVFANGCRTVEGWPPQVGSGQSLGQGPLVGRVHRVRRCLERLSVVCCTRH